MNDSDIVKLISKMQNDIDRLQSIQTPYPIWQNFTATASGTSGSAGTYAEDNAYARWYVFGKSAHVMITKRITDKGSWGGDFRILAPAGVSSIPFYNVGGQIIAQGALQRKSFLGTWNGAYFAFYTTFPFVLTTWADITVNDWVIVSAEFEIT